METDYIVVGGGTSGCIIAARLADAGFNVVLFDAGYLDEYNWRILNLKNWTNLLGSNYDYNYKAQYCNEDYHQLNYSRAKLLGGCSSHNSCIAFDPPESDLKEWVKNGAIDWDLDNMRCYLNKVKNKVNIENTPLSNEFHQDFIKSTNKIGINTIKFNQKENIGIGWFDMNKRDNVRQSSSVAYLHPLSKWRSLSINLNTQVIKVLIKNKKAIGVLTLDGNIFYAKKEIIISCGAIDTPKLLLLSGIGPKDHLKDIRIELIQDLPGVGNNLLDHYETVINYETHYNLTSDSINGWELGIFYKSKESLQDPDIMMNLGTSVFTQNTKIYGYPTARYGFSITPIITRPKSKGYIKLKNKNPLEHPIINLNYFSDMSDCDTLIKGFKKAREIMQQSPMEKWIKRELTPGLEVQSDKDILTYIKKTCNTSHHMSGTCKMGIDKMSVIDPELKVYGISNLRIADASIFPTMIGVNPCITVMMIGEKCADLILKSKSKL